MDRICITQENVDELIERYEDEYWTSKQISETFSVMSRNTIADWARAGEVRWYAVEKREKNKPWNRYSVADCISARMRHRRLRPFLRRKRADGQMEFRCNRCNEWKLGSEYYEDRKRKQAGKQFLLPYCKKCHNQAGQKHRSESPETRMRERERFSQRYAELRERRLAAKKWKPQTWIETDRIIAMIDARFPKIDPNITQYAHDTLTAEGGGLHHDAIRSLRRSKRTRVSNVDKVFVGLHMTHELAVINQEIERDRPKWHPDHAYCVMCQRDDKTYAARGMCSTCYRNRNKEDYLPVTGSKWAMRYVRCRDCQRTDRPHSGRGYCATCWQRRRKAGTLKVGSGHGNDGLVQQEAEATSRGGSGGDDLRRIAG